MNRKQIIRIAEVMLATAAAVTLTGAAEARTSSRIIVVRPTQLPELARVPGQAMLLRETADGRAFLYIEQNGGHQLAIFDVTDPTEIKEEAAARLDAPGPFDFVSSLGEYGELVRFQNGLGDGILNLHSVKYPTLITVQGLDFQGSIQRLGDDGFILPDQRNVQADATNPNLQIVDLSDPLHPNPVADVKQVREEITNGDTGTTFLLAADGLYVVRRPTVEEEYYIHEWQMSHPG